MIVAVTPNPAWDVTYRVPALRPGETHRATVAAEIAGGKGTNVAGVLSAMGVRCTAVAAVGRETLEVFTRDLDARGVPHRLVAASTPTRRCVAVVDDTGASTVLNEVGVPAQEDDLDALAAAALEGLAPGDVLVVSGSLPPDADPRLVARLARGAARAGAHTVLDVRGPALLEALAEGPSLVKPNRQEAAATLDVDDADPRRVAAALVERGAQAAVVSDGAAGFFLVRGDVALHGSLDTALTGNATGAGDALTAALAAALDGRPDLPSTEADWTDALHRAVAWSAAAVLRPSAGDVDPGDVARLTLGTRVAPLP